MTSQDATTGRTLPGATMARRITQRSNLVDHHLQVDGESCASATNGATTNEATTAVLDGVSSGACVGNLDREHQLYVRKVVEAIRTGDDAEAHNEQRDVYRSLRGDAG